MYNTQQKYTRWGAVFPGAGSPVLMIGADLRVVKMFGSSFTKCAEEADILTIRNVGAMLSAECSLFASITSRRRSTSVVCV
jgi:hypothetical protein